MSKNVSAANGATLVETIRRYASHESPSGDPHALAVLAEVLEKDALEAGLTVSREVHSSGDHLVWSLPARGSGQPDLLFLSHYDTVWPVGTLETMPISIDGDRLSGPGVYDTKSGLAVLLDALARIHLSECSHGEIRVVVVADEEVGSPTATALIQREANGADIVLGLEPPHPGGDLKTARRGSTRARVSVIGVEAHAALDLAAGTNAIDELFDQLSAIKVAASVLPVLLNVGTIAGGGRTNVVPGHAHADLGLRFSSPSDEKVLLGALDKLQPTRPAAVVTTSLLSHRPTWVENSAGLRLRDSCAEIASSIGQKLGGYPADGAADTNTAGALGRPTVDGLAPHGGGAHAAHEWVSLSGIQARSALIVALIVGLSVEPAAVSTSATF